MRVQGAARAQIEIGQMVGKTSRDAADRARKKENDSRIEAAEEQLEAATKDEKKGWAEFGIQMVMSALSAVASVATLGVSSMVDAARVAIQVIQSIAQFIAAIVKQFVGSGAKDNEHAAKLLEVEASKEKEIADRSEQRAAQTESEAREFRKEIEQQLKALNAAVKV